MQQRAAAPLLYVLVPLSTMLRGIPISVCASDIEAMTVAMSFCRLFQSFHDPADCAQQLGTALISSMSVSKDGRFWQCP
ncbi:hypothetical protein JKP88DRAFT_234996 [Tribonema minus]|uniref:Secreted protein n=1 Tax=Tribonema minus TaxID=303371 RepID=A0A835ZEZ2_9STRA|nr:hypothetical protein JKP88DRAFT_234996 [Tribonema minus]